MQCPGHPHRSSTAYDLLCSVLENPERKPLSEDPSAESTSLEQFQKNLCGSARFHLPLSLFVYNASTHCFLRETMCLAKAHWTPEELVVNENQIKYNGKNIVSKIVISCQFSVGVGSVGGM